MYICYNSFSVKANMTIDSVEDAISELQLFRQAGGQTVVDVSTVGIRLKTEELPRIARDSGVNVIAGTGFYFDAFVPEETKMMSVQEVRSIAHIPHVWMKSDFSFPFVCFFSTHGKNMSDQP